MTANTNPVAENQFAIGVDFGGTKMLGVLVDADGHVAAEHRLPTPYNEKGLLDSIFVIVRELEEKTGCKAIGIGAGAAGLVSRDGVLRNGPNLGGVTFVDVKSGIHDRLPHKLVRVENDVTCAVWGESTLGVAKGHSHIAFVTLGTGIGGGLVNEGRLLLGKYGFAGEFGHTIVQPNGALCVCGKHGCWEAYASGSAIGRLGRELVNEGRGQRILQLAGDDAQLIRGEHVTAAARQGDDDALIVMNTYARFFAIGVSNVINVFDPEVVVIGGGVVREADLFMDEANRLIPEFILGYGCRPEVPILIARLGERAGAIGAAMLIHREEVSMERDHLT